MHALLERIRAAIEEATAGADAQALQFHAPRQWSTTEILDHLSTTYAGTARLLGRRLSEGEVSEAAPTVQQRIAQVLVLGFGYFPAGRKAPEFALPRGASAENILEEIRGNLEQMDRQLTACEERFGRSTRLASHFIFGPLTAEQWRKFHLRHALHHMQQVRALRQSRAQAAG